MCTYVATHAVTQLLPRLTHARAFVQMDTYNDAQRLKFNVQALHPFKYAAESRNLLTAIEAFDAL